MTDCPLTQKELESVQSLADGKSVPEAAKTMRLSRFTVQVLIREAKSKMGESTAAGLVAAAFRNGWIA